MSFSFVPLSDFDNYFEEWSALNFNFLGFVLFLKVIREDINKYRTEETGLSVTESRDQD